MGSQERSQVGLNELEALVRNLADRIETLSLGMRYRRADALACFAAQVRQAQEHVQQALKLLELPPTEASADPETSWLRERLGKLSRRLARGAFTETALLEPTSLATGVTASAGFQGNSNSIALPEVLSMLQMQAQTGVLRVSVPGELVTLEFAKGELVHAYSSNTPEGQRLGEILVRRGVLSSEQLAQVLEDSGSKKQRLGDALRNLGLANEEALRGALDEQMQGMFHRLIAAARSEYAFHEGEINTGADRAHVNLMQLLLESARTLDEAKS